MFTTSVMGDDCTHGAKIITGSATRLVNGQPVARMGDLVDCPLHGINPIIIVDGGMPFTDDMLTAHQIAEAECGAIILPSIYSSTSGISSSEAALMESDDDLEGDAVGSSGGQGGGSGGPSQAQREARARALKSAPSDADDPSEPTTEATAPVPTSCRDIPANAPDSLRLSKFFTLRDLSSGVALAGRGGTSGGAVANRGLSRQEIICNLRHLAINTLDPIASHFGRKAMLITSGFRNAEGGSDHNIGSAVDINFFINGQKQTGRALSQIEKTIIEQLRVPFTQIINENTWLHLACRKNGVNSAKRVCWWGGGSEYHSGYRYQV